MTETPDPSPAPTRPTLPPSALPLSTRPRCSRRPRTSAPPYTDPVEEQGAALRPRGRRGRRVAAPGGAARRSRLRPVPGLPRTDPARLRPPGACRRGGSRRLPGERRGAVSLVRRLVGLAGEHLDDQHAVQPAAPQRGQQPGVGPDHEQPRTLGPREPVQPEQQPQPGRVEGHDAVDPQPDEGVLDGQLRHRPAQAHRLGRVEPRPGVQLDQPGRGRGGRAVGHVALLSVRAVPGPGPSSGGTTPRPAPASPRAGDRHPPSWRRLFAPGPGCGCLVPCAARLAPRG